MPRFRGVVVRVTDIHGVPLAEYGNVRRDRSRLASCYIESKTNMGFRISVTAENPFLLQIVDSDDEEDSKPKSTNKDSDRIIKVSASNRSRSSEYAPWHLLATMRLDGRQEAEKRAIIFLDELWERPHSTPLDVVIKDRIVKGSDGRALSCGWLFRDVGIETVFDRLMALESADEAALPGKENEDLTAGTDELDANLEDAQEETKAGHIEITLDRVTLDRVAESREFEGDKTGPADTIMSSDDMVEVSHTVARDGGRRTRKPVRMVGYDLVEPDEKPYAVFKFYYRDAEKLAKLDFPEFRAKKVPGKAIQQGKEALSKAAAAPLGITLNKSRPNFVNHAPSKDSNNDLENKADGENHASNPDSVESKQVSSGPKWSKVSLTATSDDSPGECSTHGSDNLNASSSQIYSDRYIPRISLLLKEKSTEQGLSSTKEVATPKSPKNEEVITLLPSSSSDGQTSATAAAAYTAASEEASSEGVFKFNIIQADTKSGDDADDEASDGSRTPKSMDFRAAESGTNEDDDGGISRNEADHGISSMLDEVSLGTKRSNEEESEEDNSDIGKVIKKSKAQDDIHDEEHVYDKEHGNEE